MNILPIMILIASTQAYNKTLFTKNGSQIFNLNDVDYPPLEMVESVQVQTFIIILYSLTAVISVLGNFTVIVVLALGQRSSGDLRIFLINLAISDLLMAAFSIPFTYTMFMLGRWIFPPALCPVVVYFQHMSVLVSVYTLAAIGIDRYKAILHPFERRVTRVRSRLILAAIWLASGTISCGVLPVTRAERFMYAKEWIWDCGEQWGNDGEAAKIYTLLVFVITFGVPLVALGFTYSAVAWRLWRRASPGNADPARDQLQLRAKKKVINMLITIVLLFAVCWLPLQVFLLLYYFVPGFGTFLTEQEQSTYAFVFLACHWLACANSCVNPIVYCFMSENFMADLKDLLLSVRGRGRSRGLQAKDRRLGKHSSACSSNSTRLTTLSFKRSGVTTERLADQSGTGKQQTFIADSPPEKHYGGKKSILMKTLIRVRTNTPDVSDQSLSSECESNCTTRTTVLENSLLQRHK